MNKEYRTSIDRLLRDKWYQSGLIPSVDWVAGGNFEGGISRKYMRFHSDSDIVEMRIDKLCERGGKAKKGVILTGKYAPSHKGAISIVFNNVNMIGFVLGDDNEYIAFDVSYVNIKYGVKEGYELE